MRCTQVHAAGGIPPGVQPGGLLPLRGYQVGWPGAGAALHKRMPKAVVPTLFSRTGRWSEACGRLAVRSIHHQLASQPTAHKITRSNKKPVAQRLAAQKIVGYPYVCSAAVTHLRMPPGPCHPFSCCHLRLAATATPFPVPVPPYARARFMPSAGSSCTWSKKHVRVPSRGATPGVGARLCCLPSAVPGGSRRP